MMIPKIFSNPGDSSFGKVPTHGDQHHVTRVFGAGVGWVVQDPPNESLRVASSPHVVGGCLFVSQRQSDIPSGCVVGFALDA